MPEQPAADHMGMRPGIREPGDAKLKKIAFSIDRAGRALS
jgi:hypothetical protein